VDTPTQAPESLHSIRTEDAVLDTSDETIERLASTEDDDILLHREHSRTILAHHLRYESESAPHHHDRARRRLVYNKVELACETKTQTTTTTTYMIEDINNVSLLSLTGASLWLALQRERERDHESERGEESCVRV